MNQYNSPYPPSPSQPYYGPPQVPLDPKTLDYGFNRRVSLLESPPVGASFIAITLFFLIAFMSNFFSGYTFLAGLGLAITFSVIGIMSLLILILFLI